MPSLYMPWWQGLWAPIGVVAKLDRALVEALTDPVIVRRFKELGLLLSTREQQTPKVLEVTTEQRSKGGGLSSKQ